MSSVPDLSRSGNRDNPGKLGQLGKMGQAVWLDFLERKFLTTGGLRELIENDHVTGVTSNPSIFEKAMAKGDVYDQGIHDFLSKSDASVQEVYEHQAIADIKAAAADLRPVYDRLDGRDGYVSLEVSPYLAQSTQETVEEARRLWKQVDEPNLMIKVPGTKSGVRALRALIEEGININVTLLFSVDVYQCVAEAYMEGLEARLARNLAVRGIASVASFFVSRIDSQMDKKIDARASEGDPQSQALRALRGKIAIANAKVAYARYRGMISSERWRALAARGAMPQRLLWASTGTKDAAYADTMYVDSLIGPDTISTIPPNTMDAFRDHGVIGETLTANLDEARQVMAETERLGLDLAGGAERLVADGVQQFSDAADALFAAVAAKRIDFIGSRLNRLECKLPGDLEKNVEDRLEGARVAAWPRRLHKGDATLWTGRDEARWLGWLPAAVGHGVDLQALEELRDDTKMYRDAVLIGMGGSSLGPEVLARIMGSCERSPHLHVLDTTDPEQIASVEAQIDPTQTLFIVSSKSGSTMEPSLLLAYFFEKCGRQGVRFIAVTDPGSALETQARQDGFAHIFAGEPTIGGRYSVLSAFGMVPAAVMGLDVRGFLQAARTMRLSCGSDVPPAQNPGVRLGVVLGEAAIHGRNKLTIVASKRLAPFGAWLEQLLAESTGKEGKGIVPVDLEPLGAPESYGADRLFVHLALAGDDDAENERKLAALRNAGHPIVSIYIADPMLIGQEFVRWEIATAIAGAVIGIDPFDQPDVEEAKVATRRLVDACEKNGELDPEAPAAETADFTIFAAGGQNRSGNAEELLTELFATLKPGGYFGFLAYLERDDANAAAIAVMRKAVRDATRCATVAGFGPRFLHSTGQAYKGGPQGGVFLTITREPDADLIVPGRDMTFGTVQLAQARGDTDVLAARGRNVLRIHLKKNGHGIDALEAAVLNAL
jgi:transaldolase/glucose-6-phosphate isomerase